MLHCNHALANYGPLLDTEHCNAGSNLSTDLRMRILLSGLEQADLAHPLFGLWDELVARADCQLTGGHMLSRKTVQASRFGASSHSQTAKYCIIYCKPRNWITAPQNLCSEGRSSRHPVTYPSSFGQSGSFSCTRRFDAMLGIMRTFCWSSMVCLSYHAPYQISVGCRCCCEC